MKAKWDTGFVPGFQTGTVKSGMLWQGYNYGPNAIHWLWGYLWARKTAGKGDEFALFDYITPFAKRHIYDRTPDNWRVYTEGDWPSATSFVMPSVIPLLATSLGGSTTGGWMRKFYDEMAVYPGGSAVPRPAAWERFVLQNPSVAAVDYTATLPLSIWFDGDYHTITRSDWTTSATWAVFSADAAAIMWGDHQMPSWGNIEIVRGGDHLLISPSQWRSGSNGVTGSFLGDASERAGWQYNTLFINDGSAYCLDQTNVIAYLGCQMFYATDAQNGSNPPYYAAPVHKETVDFAYSKQNLRPGYDKSSWSPHGGSVTAYVRSYLAVGGSVFFVYDRVAVSSAAYDWRLLWWMNPGATTTQPASDLMKSTIGNSTLWGKLSFPRRGRSPWLMASPHSTLAPS